MPALPDEDITLRIWNAIQPTVIRMHTEIQIADTANTLANDKDRRACINVGRLPIGITCEW